LTHNWWTVALRGLCAILFGLATIARPGVTLTTLVLFFGFFAIVAAIELRKAIAGEWLLGLNGAAALLFGLGVAVYPGIGTLLLLSAIAAYAIIAGAMQIVLGLRLRRLNAERQQAAART